MAGVPAAPPEPNAPARLAAGSAPAAQTAITVPAALGLGPLDVDEWSVPRDCPVIAALPYLNWVVPPAPAAVRVPVSEVQGVVLAACTFDLSDPALCAALRNANLVPIVPTMAREP